VPVILANLELACLTHLILPLLAFHHPHSFLLSSLPFGKVVRMNEAAMDKLIAPHDEAVLEVLYEVGLCVCGLADGGEAYSG
jgi:hypothetical protein